MLCFHAGHSPPRSFLTWWPTPGSPWWLHSCTFPFCLPASPAGPRQSPVCPKGLLSSSVKAFPPSSPLTSPSQGERDPSRKPSPGFPCANVQRKSRAGPVLSMGIPSLHGNLRTHRGDCQVIFYWYSKAGLIFSCCLVLSFHMCLVILLHISSVCEAHSCAKKALNTGQIHMQHWHVWHRLLLQLCLYTSVPWPFALQILRQIWSWC